MFEAPPPENGYLLELFSQIETAGTISRHDYFRLMTVLLSKHTAPPDTCVRINAIFDGVRLNRLQITD